MDAHSGGQGQQSQENGLGSPGEDPGPDAGVDPLAETLAADDAAELAVGTPAPVPDLAALGWVPVLQDEFTSLDETKWAVSEGRGSSREAVSTSASHPGEAVSGFLTLKTYSVDTNGSTAGGLVHYSGGIYTDGNDILPHGLFSATGGYIEARIKFENQSGTSSDLWTLSSSGQRSFDDPGESGPETGFEHTNSSDGGPCNVDHECNTQPIAVLGWDGYEEDYQADQARVENPNPNGTPLLQGSFHRYGMLWGPDGYRFYIDGIQVFETTDAITYRPEFLLLTQQHSSSSAFMGPIPAAGYGGLANSTNRTVVDYVKVWQRPVSQVPDQQIGSDEAISVPLQVTDYAYSLPGTAAPSTCAASPTACRRPSVRVTATSSNQTVLPNSNLVVTGNAPTDPNGSFQNSAFTTNLTGWTPTGETTWDGRTAGTAGSLRLGAGDGTGGQATQTITGLAPNTTYVLGHYGDPAVDWTDTNGNGLIDWTDTDKDGRYDVDGPSGQYTYRETGEPLVDVEARYDWGIADVDSSLGGAQRVAKTSERNWWTLKQNAWVADYLTFTTGPSTTSVTVFFTNEAYADTMWDSTVYVDDVYVRPVIPPSRTVTLAAAAGASGTATVTLTARDEAGVVLGTDQFDVVVSNRSSFGNGGFEAYPLGTGWEFMHPASVVTLDPFQLDHALQLAGEDTDSTVIQHVTGLLPDTDYVLDLSTKVAASGSGSNPNEVYYGVLNTGTGGTTRTATSSATAWTAATVPFHTGDEGVADVAVFDWDETDGASLVDDMRLRPASVLSQTPLPMPLLDSLGEQHTVAGSPLALAFDATNRTITSVTSDNPYLLPAANVGRAGSGARQVLGLTPVPDRTGIAYVTVSYTSPTGSGSKRITVVVSHAQFASPGFEPPTSAWTLGSGASLVGGGLQRSGDLALQLSDDAEATQSLITRTPGSADNGVLTFGRSYLVAGWGRAGAKLTITELRADGDKVLGTVTWTSTGWTRQQTVITTGPRDCAMCGAQRPRVVLTLEDASGAADGSARVDDLTMQHTPVISPIRDLSLFAGQATPSWTNETTFRVGRIPTEEAFWDDAMVSITSSKEQVVPLANVTLEQVPGMPTTWRVRVAAGTITGTSTLTVRVLDPRTGAWAERSFVVSVSAGSSFNNGAFQRGLSGWWEGWFLSRYVVVPLRPEATPKDFDQVLMLEQGIVVTKVTGLLPDHRYSLRGRAFGKGSGVTVRSAPYGMPGSVYADTPFWVASTTWRSFQVDFTTPADVTDAWISIEDGGYDDTTSTPNPCTIYDEGRACYDDLHLLDLGPA